MCRAYFMDGPGCSGKTMVYNTCINCCRSPGEKASAGTGIGAILVGKARVCHNLFKLPVPILETSICHISPTSVHAAFLRSVTMFIVDEASMIPAHALAAINKILRDITGLDGLFGGKMFSSWR